MDETVQKIFTPGKGILAADESTKTITKRFASLGIISTPEVNRKYRQMLFETPGIVDYISGAILFDETVYQKNNADISFIDLLAQKGIVPGIKVDEGTEVYNSTTQKVTKGLDNLSERFKKYAALGLKFSKWRGIFEISDLYPSPNFIKENVSRMAKYAKISQENNIVPIVEPEILLDGNHTTTRCAEISALVLSALFTELKSLSVSLPALILKTSMVLPGKASTVKAEPLEVAEATLRVFRSSVPPEVGGIVFLSGGQTPNEAFMNMNEIIKRKSSQDPWEISFSFGRALQEDAMKLWSAKMENVKEAQEVFTKTLELAGRARRGEL